MSESQLRTYSNTIKNLKSESERCGISEEEFKQMYVNSLQEINIEDFENISLRQYKLAKMFKYKKYIILLIVVVIILFNIKSIYSIIICNLQEYIYPGLHLLRRLAIPFISLFPSLANWYEETCLIQNPFFKIVDMDCWPCSSINSIREVTDPISATQLHPAPFIYKTEQEVLDWKRLENVFLQNKDIFEYDSAKVIVNNMYYVTPSHMFLSLLKNSGENHLFIWKFNNMNSARILRQHIPRPKVVPKFGQSTERFLIIDTSQSSFKIPDTECNFSFILSVKGNRRIVLMPSEECKHQCKSLETDLIESHLLWYNWWYWRPYIKASHHNDTLIAHVGSYC